MTHNIETVSDRNGLGMSSRGSVPCVDDPSLYRSYANRPVLQILDLEDSGNEVEILFRHDAIMIAPWDTKRRVLITREDLFAFRELLRELPEESFVRPADPVEKVTPWEDGDVVTFDGKHVASVWTRVNGVWQNYRTKGRPGLRSGTLTDEQMDLRANGSGAYTTRRRAGVIL